MILIPPNTPHSCEYEEFFGDEFIQFSSCDFPKIPILIHDIDGNISKLFYIIQKLYVEKEAYYHELIESFLNSVLIYIQKSISFEITYPFVYTFKDVLYKNLSNSEFDVGSAILESGYNPDYFRRCF